MKFPACLFVLFITASSLFGQVNPSGSGYDIHVIRKKETLTSIAKRYYTTPENLLKLNPNISLNEWVTGTRVNVPVATSEMKKNYRAHEKMLRHAIFYTVQKKETINAVAKKYNTDSKTLMFWNNLSKPALKEGQQLIVGFTNEKYAPKPPSASIGTSSPPPSSSPRPATGPSLNLPEENSRKVNRVESGAGEWIRNVDDGGNYYALHSTVPAGSTITVKNLMNNKTVTVKVIGKLPSTAENEHIIIKLSASAAKALNILDDKFRVELSYWSKQ